MFKKGPTFLTQKLQKVDVDILIPYPKMTNGEREIWNLCSLLKIMRKNRRNISSALYELSYSPHSSAKRKALCRKWGRKIMIEKMRKYGMLVNNKFKIINLNWNI